MYIYIYIYIKKKNTFENGNVQSNRIYTLQLLDSTLRTTNKTLGLRISLILFKNQQLGCVLHYLIHNQSTGCVEPPFFVIQCQHTKNRKKKLLLILHFVKCKILTK